MITNLIKPNLKQTAILISLASLASLLSAWFIQYVLGFEPCQLCYTQRWPYYLGFALGLGAWLATSRSQDNLARLLVGVVGIIMLTGAGIAIYHSGVEWKYWPGPPTCSTVTAMSANVTDLLAQAKQAQIVPCDQPPFRLFGLSPANDNVLISIVFSAFCFYAIRLSWKRQPY